MKSIVSTSCLVFLLSLAGPATHAQDLQQLIDRGTDGDVRYYTVICASGKRTSIANHYKEGQICTMLVNGKQQVCREGWTIDKAATTACQ